MGIISRVVDTYILWDFSHFVENVVTGWPPAGLHQLDWQLCVCSPVGLLETAGCKSLG